MLHILCQPYFVCGLLICSNYIFSLGIELVGPTNLFLHWAQKYLKLALLLNVPVLHKATKIGYAPHGSKLSGSSSGRFISGNTSSVIITQEGRYPSVSLKVEDKIILPTGYQTQQHLDRSIALFVYRISDKIR